MTPREILLGGFRVSCLDAGSFAIPRDSMYVAAVGGGKGGFPPGTPEKFVLSMNAFLVEGPSGRILIDPGVGAKPSGPAAGLAELVAGPGLAACLAERGLAPKDIDLVVNTHLHFDHAGGNTEAGPDGRVRPAFPNADYIIQKGEWETGLCPPAGDRGSYVAADFEPLAAAGRLRLVEGDAPLAAGLTVLATPGHTAHHQSVLLRAGEAAVLFAGDLVPTAAHVGFGFIMSYDLDSRLVLKTKRAVYERLGPSGWILALPHDPRDPFGTVERDGPRFGFRPLT
jgi:glyoxylase-like metal-dependent hydrolase (beta-lactamase superfamily II)